MAPFHSVLCYLKIKCYRMMLRAIYLAGTIGPSSLHNPLGPTDLNAV